VFDQVNGLPAHPLFVHAPLVLIALTLLLGLVYVVVPPLRPRVDWALVLLALAGPVSALLATTSGERLAVRLKAGSSDAVVRHETFGDLTRNLAALLFVVVVMLVVVDRVRARRVRHQQALSEGDDPGRPGRTVGGGVWVVLSVVLSVLLLGVGGTTGAYLYLTGDSGSRMVWGGVPR
jgi:uncharacterized membrane protein